MPWSEGGTGRHVAGPALAVSDERRHESKIPQVTGPAFVEGTPTYIRAYLRAALQRCSQLCAPDGSFLDRDLLQEGVAGGQLCQLGGRASRTQFQPEATVPNQIPALSGAACFVTGGACYTTCSSRAWLGVYADPTLMGWPGTLVRITCTRFSRIVVREKLHRSAHPHSIGLLNDWHP